MRCMYILVDSTLPAWGISCARGHAYMMPSFIWQTTISQHSRYPFSSHPVTLKNLSRSLLFLLYISSIFRLESVTFYEGVRWIVAMSSCQQIQICKFLVNRYIKTDRFVEGMSFFQLRYKNMYIFGQFLHQNRQFEFSNLASVLLMLPISQNLARDKFILFSLKIQTWL